MNELIASVNKSDNEYVFFEIINGDKTMAKKNDTFKIFFENIKLEDRLPLVFHCTAGKYIFI